MISLKCLLIGDGAVGKTCLLISRVTGAFPAAYVPTVFDNYSCSMTLGEHAVNLSLWDTAGQEDYDRLRPLSYPGTDVFVIVYSVGRRASFENLSKWRDEVYYHCPGQKAAPRVLLIGNKVDLANEREVPWMEGKAYADRNGWAFEETSALTRENVDAAFEHAVRIGLRLDLPLDDGSAGCCVLSVLDRCLGSLTARCLGGKDDASEDDESDIGQHTEPVWCLAVEGDGEYLYSGSRDHSVRQWHLSTGTTARTFVGHSGEVYQIDLWGGQVVSCGSGGAVVVSDRQGQVARTLTHEASVNAFGITANDHIFCATNANSVVQWDLPSGAQGSVYKSGSGVNCVFVDADAGVLVGGCADGVVRMWHLGTDAAALELAGHKGSINHLLPSPGPGGDSPAKAVRLVTADATGVVCVWEVAAHARGSAKAEDGRCSSLGLVTAFTEHKDAVNAICTSAGRAFSASRDGTLKSFATGGDPQALLTFYGHTSTVRACAVDASGKFLVSGGKDATIRCHDTDSAALLWFFDGHSDYINRILVSGDKAYSAGRDGTVRAWKLQSGRLARVYGNRAARLDGELKPYVAVGAGVIVILTDFMQYMAFPFTNEEVVWEEETNPFTFLAPPFLLQFSVLESTYHTLAYAVMAFVVLVFASFHLSYKAINYRNVWALTALLCWLSTEILLVPIFRVLLLAADCTEQAGRQVLRADPDVLCWDSEHLALVVAAAVCLVMHLIVSLRLTYVNGDLSRIAVYFWTSWKFDSPYVGKVHPLSRRNAIFNRSQTVMSVFLVAWSVFGVGLAPYWSTAAFLAGALYLGVVSYWIPPYWTEGANAARLASLSAVVATNISALFVVQYNSESVQHRWTTFLLLSSMGAAAILAAVLMVRRVRQVNQTVALADVPFRDRESDANLSRQPAPPGQGLVLVEM